jgi:thioredoxin 1
MPTGFDTPIHTNDHSIDRVLAAGLPTLLVFVDGQAPAALDDMLRKLARQHQGELLVALVQAKDNPVSVQKFQIEQLPAVLAVQGGRVIGQAGGADAQSAAQHAEFVLGRGPKPQTSSPQAKTAQSGQAGASAPPPDSAPNRPVPVSEANFESQVFRSSQPVLVDFWAPWCGPCRMTDPILEKLAREWAGKIKIAKVNVDENPGISQKYGVQGIPTMMVVKNGSIVDKWVGALPEPALRSRVSPHLSR